MSQPLEVDVCIVGGGPAGTSTALHLLQRDPSWGERILILEGARHPREKLCGGGISPPGDDVIARLGIQLDVPQFELDRIVFRHGDDLRVLPAGFRVVRRREFDAQLVRETRARGVRVLEDSWVRNLAVDSDGVDLECDAVRVRAKVVVGADGAKSTVRRKLRWSDGSYVARLLEVITPVPADQLLVETRTALFDFSDFSPKMSGYYWDFPCFEAGAPHINSGMFDSCVARRGSGASLRALLSEGLLRRAANPEEIRVEGHPIRWLHPSSQLSQPRVLLVGDAAGTDPLLGEGISFALAYGEVAAEALQDAFGQGNFDFSDYGERVRGHRYVGTLSVRHSLAVGLAGSSEPWQMAGALLDQVLGS